MHLKNFSLIENSLGEYEFSPAYDLLSTVIVIPEDKEESALTINGKKSRLKKSDFNALANALKINDKSLEAIYTRFKIILPQWISLIEQSFLSKNFRQEFIELIDKRHRKLFA